MNMDWHKYFLSIAETTSKRCTCFADSKGAVLKIEE